MKAAKINCWEHKQCGRQPGGALGEQLGPCTVATDTTCDGINGDKNAGRLCWAIADTLCEGKVCDSYSQKTSRCQKCSFFRRVKYEKGCHFQLFRPGLRISDTTLLHLKLNDIVKLVTMYRDIFACMAVLPLLERITRHAITVTRCSAAGAYLFEDPPKKLSLKAGSGTIALPTTVSLDNDSPISAAIVNRSTRKGSIMLPDRTEAASIIASPIGGEQGLTGVMVLVKSSGEFSIDDEWFLGEFAILAGLGIGNSRLIESLRDMRQVDKAKSRVVSLLVHQIGSPLATIACSLTALLDAENILDRIDRRKLLECSLDRANSIARLSKKLLDLAAIRSASYLADTKGVCVSEILREEVELRHAQARQVALDITLHIDIGAKKELVQADPEGLRLIFANLLDNAIKYSTSKGKEIKVSLDSDTHRLRICVGDEGIGIPIDQRDRLFEEFHRASNAAAAGVKGFGLGLAFVKELVGRYNGLIDLPLWTPPEGDESRH
ncbi:MAG: ATP-binding protein [Planctomycetota bacterium]|jgi:signal transduction histidine kinase|nr:ATP-binding protein [Planctomycetota bacterium]